MYIDLYCYFKPNIKGFIEDTKSIPKIVHAILCSQGPTRKGHRLHLQRS